MLHIKMPFGYNSFCLDHSFVIHTGKIRIKADYAYINEELSHCTQLMIKPTGNVTQYTVISFATTCQQTNDHLITEINKMLCKIMHKRIDEKYAPNKWEPELEIRSVGKIDLTQFIAL